MLKLMRINIFLLFWLATLGCQETVPEIFNPDIADAKSWFENNVETLNTSYFKKSPDWKKSNVFLMKNGRKAIEVALNYDNHLIFSENKNLAESSPRIINTMILTEIIPGHYGVYLVKVYPDNSTSVEDIDEVNFESIPSSFSGSMMVFDWNENFLGGWKIIEGKKTNFYGKISNSNKSDIRASSTNSYYCYAIDTYWYSQACAGDNCAPAVLIEITTVIVCEYQQQVAPITDDPNQSGANPVANQGCYTEHPLIEGLIVPCEETASETIGIDCASFQFVATNNTWQESSVLDVGFKVSIVALNGVISTSTMKVDRPIWFGFPITDYNGNTMAPGEAAEKAASAVQYASDLVGILYFENPTTPLSMGQSLFMSFLKSKMLMNGGRADFYGSGSALVTPSIASYAYLGNGNCY